jgi:hypothetical protein
MDIAEQTGICFAQQNLNESAKLFTVLIVAEF